MPRRMRTRRYQGLKFKAELYEPLGEKKLSHRELLQGLLEELEIKKPIVVETR